VTTLLGVSLSTSHDVAAPVSPTETANFNGLAQTDSPSSIRSSINSATASAALAGTADQAMRRSIRLARSRL
jgi:hypothetical protein